MSIIQTPKKCSDSDEEVCFQSIFKLSLGTNINALCVQRCVHMPLVLTEMLMVAIRGECDYCDVIKIR